MQIVKQTHKKPTKSRHKKLLSDPDVRRRHENIARGSTMTADVRIRRLSVYCEITNMAPREFAQIGINSIKKAEDLLLDYVSFLEKNGYASSYIEDILKALRSWISFNYVKMVRKIKIKNADIPITLENEEIPSKQKLSEILDSVSARERVCISFIAFTGIRPQVLGKYDSSDGLKLSGITDNEIDAIKDAIQNNIRKNREKLSELPTRKYESKIAHSEVELLSCVEDGWNVAKDLSNGNVVLRRNQTRASGQSD